MCWSKFKSEIFCFGFLLLLFLRFFICINQGQYNLAPPLNVALENGNVFTPAEIDQSEIGSTTIGTMTPRDKHDQANEMMATGMTNARAGISLEPTNHTSEPQGSAFTYPPTALTQQNAANFSNETGNLDVSFIWTVMSMLRDKFW